MAKVDVGKGDAVAAAVGAALNDTLSGDDGVGVAAVDDGGTHATRTREPISNARIARP
jgi:TPP-dependent pyruvate/acetoin dehydrogenase alpha subunit